MATIVRECTKQSIRLLQDEFRSLQQQAIAINGVTVKLCGEQIVMYLSVKYGYKPRTIWEKLNMPSDETTN
jgi:hypothetical protein